MAKTTLLPKQIKTELVMELEKEPEIGKPFNIYLRNEWLSSESKQGNFSLLSSAGLGGTKLFFEVNGKTYLVETVPIFKNLIEQII